MSALLPRIREVRRRWAARDKAGPAPFTEGDGQLGRELYWEGEPAWGWALVAWASLFQPGPYDGRVVFLHAEGTDASVDRLQAAHDAYWELRTKGSSAPGLRSLVPWARHDEPHPGGRFPPLLSSGGLIWHAPAYVQRTQLPGRHLRSTIVPIARFNDRRRPEVVVLPSLFWTDEMIADWSRSPTPG